MMQFYVLEPYGREVFGKTWAYAEPMKPWFLDGFPVCPVCNKPIGLKKVLPPILLRLSQNNPAKWPDLLWDASGLYVSIQARMVYESERLTGITKFIEPVNIAVLGARQIVELPEVQHKTYFHINVIWNGAILDEAASGKVYEHMGDPECSYCRLGVIRRQDRIVLEEGSWTGADIFTPRGGPVNYLVSQRFKDVVEKHQLTGGQFIPAEKWAYDVDREDGPWYVRD